MQYVITEGKLILSHLSILLVVLVFGPLLGYGVGVIAFNIIATLFYFGFLYSTAWKVAKSDIDKRSTTKPFAAKGLLIGMINLAVILGITYFMYPFKNGQIMFYVYGAWTMPIFVWYRYFEKEIIPLVLTMLMLPIATTVGYYMGMKKIKIDYDFLYPIFYKTRKK